MDLERTVNLERDSSAAEEKLRVIGDRVAKFFVRANNQKTPELTDLDPREGFVKLEKTATHKHIGFGITHIQGLMDPSGKIEATLTEGEAESKLTMTEFGGRISWEYDSQGRICEQTVEQTSLGMQNYQAEINQDIEG